MGYLRNEALEFQLTAKTNNFVRNCLTNFNCFIYEVKV